MFQSQGGSPLSAKSSMSNKAGNRATIEEAPDGWEPSTIYVGHHCQHEHADGCSQRTADSTSTHMKGPWQHNNIGLEEQWWQTKDEMYGLEEINITSRRGDPHHAMPNQTMTEVSATAKQRCEYEGCHNAPKYGPRDGLACLCKEHKRAGMFTTRKGQLLMSTRDGRGRRERSVGAYVGENASLEPEKGSGNNLPVDDSPTSLAPDQDPVERTTGCPPQPGIRPSSVHEEQDVSDHGEEDSQRKIKTHSRNGDEMPNTVGINNCPCLYPGCNTRPHYGISGGRAVYCVQHKKSGMMQILRETMAKEERRADSKCAALEDSACEGKEDIVAGMTRSGSRMAKRKPAITVKGTKQNKCIGKQQTRSVKSQAENVPEKEENPRKTDKSWGEGKEHTTAVAASNFSAEGATEAKPALDQEAKEPKLSPTEGEAAQSPRTGTMADASGAAPSVEMRILQQAREAAKVAAAKSGSGRRARVPSMKALQAAGLAEAEGAQWLTKARKMEEARKRREYKDSMREYKECKKRTRMQSAGWIAASQVMIDKPKPEVGGGGHGGNGGDGQSAAEPKEAPKNGPVSGISPHARRRQDRGGGQPILPCQRTQKTQRTRRQSGRGVGVAETSVDAVNMKENDGKCSVKEHSDAPLANVMTSTAAAKRRRQMSASADDHGAQQNVRAKIGKARENVQEDLDDIHENPTNPEISCHFDGCARTATYGVNGTVRYCEMHRIFGMHKVGARSG